MKNLIEDKILDIVSDGDLHRIDGLLFTLNGSFEGKEISVENLFSVVEGNEFLLNIDDEFITDYRYLKDSCIPSKSKLAILYVCMLKLLHNGGEYKISNLVTEMINRCNFSFTRSSVYTVINYEKCPVLVIDGMCEFINKHDGLKTQAGVLIDTVRYMFDINNIYNRDEIIKHVDDVINFTAYTSNNSIDKILNYLTNDCGEIKYLPKYDAWCSVSTDMSVLSTDSDTVDAYNKRAIFGTALNAVKNGKASYEQQMIVDLFDSARISVSLDDYFHVIKSNMRIIDDVKTAFKEFKNATLSLQKSLLPHCSNFDLYVNNLICGYVDYILQNACDDIPDPDIEFIIAELVRKDLTCQSYDLAYLENHTLEVYNDLGMPVCWDSSDEFGMIMSKLVDDGYFIQEYCVLSIDSEWKSSYKKTDKVYIKPIQVN